MAEYRGKMGRLVDAGALLRAIEGNGSPMLVPNVYVAPGSVEELDLSRYFPNGEQLTYTCTISDTSVASATINGTVLKVKGENTGSTTATIKTSAGKEQSIIITVRKGANSNGWM